VPEGVCRSDERRLKRQDEQNKALQHFFFTLICLINLSCSGSRSPVVEFVKLLIRYGTDEPFRVKDFS